jgi:hypothetical protein
VLSGKCNISGKKHPEPYRLIAMNILKGVESYSCLLLKKVFFLSFFSEVYMILLITLPNFPTQSQKVGIFIHQTTLNMPLTLKLCLLVLYTMILPSLVTLIMPSIQESPIDYHRTQVCLERSNTQDSVEESRVGH